MISASLALVFLLQGVGQTVHQVEPGAVAGILRGVDGKPLSCVRVAAMPDPKTEQELPPGTMLSSLARSDANGKFRLENIVPGRYIISAGRVDVPTYYPGTLTLDQGKSVLVEEGILLSGIDFQINETSVRTDSVDTMLQAILRLPFDNSLYQVVYQAVGNSTLRLVAAPMMRVPIDLRIENGSRIPVFAGSEETTLWFNGVSSGTTEFKAWLDDTYMSVPMPKVSTTDEYKIRITNLPDNYTVKSVTYGAEDLTKSNLRFTARGSPICGEPPDVDLETLSITLSVSAPDPSKGGVRVSGFVGAGDFRSVYLSGSPGTYFADGTFEFRNVLPGRYTLISLNNTLPARPLGASVVVGDEDILGIDLNASPLAAVPDILTSAGTRPADGLKPGTILPAASIRGQIVSAGTRQPMPGIVGINGVPLMKTGEDGQFEIQKLVPGNYNLQFTVFNHYLLNQSVSVHEDNTVVQIEVQPVK